MRIIRTFMGTLVAVIAIGGAFLYKTELTNKAKELLGSAETETKVSDSEENAADAKSTSVTDSIKKKVVTEIAETIVEEAVKQYGGDTAEDIQNIIDSVEEEDKEKVTEILTDNLSLDSIGDVQSYIANNDARGLLEYAQDKLTAEEYSELTGIFEKYSGSIKDQIDKAAD